MTVTLTNERLRELIPNVVHEVKGETPLLTKLLPWIDSASQWLTIKFLGSDYEVPERFMPVVETVVAHKALAEAVPSLDVALSPAGFAVINTDGRAPASKERVERLIASLNASVDNYLEILVSDLLHTAGWVESPMGLWWRGSFIPRLTEARRFKGQSPLFDTYIAMRSVALRFEQQLAESYLGHDTLDLLRSSQFLSPDYAEIVSMIREAELRYISAHLRDQRLSCPDEHEAWHLIRPVIDRMKYFPDLYRLWQSEMADRFKVEPFKNDIKGGFYF